MNAHELSEKIHNQLKRSTENRAEWLALLAEAEKFCASATEAELNQFRAECYGGEIFARIAKGIEYESKGATQ